MNIQEREERQHYPQSEFQLAYAASQQRIDRSPDQEQIIAAHAKGLHVVVVHVPAYCPTTDAVMGTTRHYVDAFPSRTEAETSIARRHESLDPKDYFWAGQLEHKVVSPPSSEHTAVS